MLCIVSAALPKHEIKPLLTRMEKNASQFAFKHTEEAYGSMRTNALLPSTCLTLLMSYSKKVRKHSAECADMIDGLLSLRLGYDLLSSSRKSEIQAVISLQES